MNISPIGVAALQELKKYPGFENAVIAGGFVRDAILGAKFKDLDIFIPVHNQEQLIDTVSNLFKVDYVPDKGFVQTPKGSFTDFEYDENGYREVTPHYIAKYKCKYLNILDVEIMGYNCPQEDFGQHVVNEFHYWIDQVWYDDEVHESENFLKDKRNGTATLCQMRTIQDLPYAMTKFFRHKEKYPHLRFDTIFEIRKKDTEKKTKPKYPYYSSTTVAGPDEIAFRNNVWRWEAAPRIEPRAVVEEWFDGPWQAEGVPDQGN